LLSEVTAMSVNSYCSPRFNLTSPSFRSIQFINTTNNTKDNKIKIGERCWGVTAVKNKIYIGGGGKVLILNTDGSRVREITTDGRLNYVPSGDNLCMSSEAPPLMYI
jgi:hypothetical protein